VRTEATVDANRSTPCAMNLSTLLICAVGQELAGDTNEARRLESKAEALGIQGNNDVHDPIRLQLALLRDDLDRVETLISGLEQSGTWDHWTRIGILEGWAALGEHQRIEETAAAWLLPGTYSEPFVLRVLGAVRGDRALTDQAIARFEEMGLEWHAEQTRVLAGRPT
jgi:hypothetical protein